MWGGSNERLSMARLPQRSSAPSDANTSHFLVLPDYGMGQQTLAGLREVTVSEFEVMVARWHARLRPFWQRMFPESLATIS